MQKILFNFCFKFLVFLRLNNQFSCNLNVFWDKFPHWIDLFETKQKLSNKFGSEKQLVKKMEMQVSGVIYPHENQIARSKN